MFSPGNDCVASAGDSTEMGEGLTPDEGLNRGDLNQWVGTRRID